MSDAASELYALEWRPCVADGDGLLLSVGRIDRTGLRRFAASTNAPSALRIRAADGRVVVTTPHAVLAWTAQEALPHAEGEWPFAPILRGDDAHALEMLEAFLAWTKSRGLIDEAKARRISRWVQMEMAGQAPDTRG